MIEQKSQDGLPNGEHHGSQERKDQGCGSRVRASPFIAIDIKLAQIGRFSAVDFSATQLVAQPKTHEYHEEERLQHSLSLQAKLEAANKAANQRPQPRSLKKCLRPAKSALTLFSSGSGRA